MKKPTVAGWMVVGMVLGVMWGASLVMAAASPAAQPPAQVPVLEIKTDQVKAKVSPMLYGLMTEEINYCYDGGLYAELIVNRNFKENAQTPVFWRLEQSGGGAGSMALDPNQPLNQASTTSLKLVVNSVGQNQRVGISNEGFWGIAVKPNTTYKARIDVKGGNGFTGPLTLAIVSSDGKTVFAQAQVAKITDRYQKYEATLTTGNVTATKDARFHIWAGSKGTVWFGLVSLFPPTYKNRPNGNRPDIMQLLADMNPKFLRFPGGNYLEGNTIATRFDWKKTIGDISERPGHMNDAWRYWSSDGMGLLEFLTWCEDLNIEPVMGIYAGYSLRRVWVEPGDALKPYVQDGLDEIEYAIGDTSTTWGARRAKDGHPQPFKLTYVEIGNEENLGGQNQYDGRFTQYYDAIKAKYPQLKIITATPSNTTIIQTRKPDVYDDHYYPAPAAMIALWNRYDNYDRSKPPVFVGEYATRQGNSGPITPSWEYALCDASFIVGMERNSDAVIMAAYAPLFVNVNPGGSQWQTDLIGFDVMNSFGSTCYYVQKMFSLNHGDTILTVAAQGVPMREIPRSGGRRGGDAAAPTTMQVPMFFHNATRNSATGTIYLKVVNPVDTPQPIRVKISGVASIEPSGQAVEMKAATLEATNSITEPTKVVPVTTKLDGLSTDFTRTFPAYSVTVLQLKGK